jgi:hypothetical protein
MKIIFLVLIGLATCNVWGQSSVAVEQELIALEKTRSEAIAKHDTVFLDKIYSDDFRGVTAIGYVADKSSLMRVFKLDNPDVKFAIDELAARIYENTAVVTGRLIGKTTDGKITHQSRYLHVYVKSNGRWQIVAGQGTMITDSQPGK